MKLTKLGKHLHCFSQTWPVVLQPPQSGCQRVSSDRETTGMLVLPSRWEDGGHCQNHCHCFAGSIKIQVILGYKVNTTTTVLPVDTSLASAGLERHMC